MLSRKVTARATLAAYISHPKHERAVKSYINSVRADVPGIDYEF